VSESQCRCTFSIAPEVDTNCNKVARWEVVLTEGSSRSERRYARCDDHLAKTIAFVAEWRPFEYPFYRLDRIVNANL
jgi:hypothetical protein